jgi:hypothetical protein
VKIRTDLHAWEPCLPGLDPWQTLNDAWTRWYTEPDAPLHSCYAETCCGWVPVEGMVCSDCIVDGLTHAVPDTVLPPGKIGEMP